MMDERVRSLFNPQSVAIVGASSDPQKPSGYPLRNLLAANFSGALFPVNPRGGKIQGIQCYPSLSEIPEVPDVAIIMLEASLVPKAMEECGRKGVPSAIIGAAGFSEAGAQGQERQSAVLNIARQYGVRVCGPNGHGVYNVTRNIPLGYNFSFALRLLPGPLAIASQSGALLGALATRTLKMRQGLSYLVSSGNEMDLDLCDYLEYFLEDESTKVIALLIEGLTDGNRFLDLAERAQEFAKPIVVLKVGKSERGALTTLAHTSRMAGSAEIYEAAFRQFGVISTDTVETFLGAAQMVASQPVLRDGKLMVLTSTGAGASLMADKASEYGLELAEISDETKARIPPRKSAILANPFDTAGASRSPGFLSTVCDVFASDPGNDCLLLFLGPLAVRHEYALSFCQGATKAKKAAAAIVTLSESDIEEIFREHQIPLFDLSTDACFRVLQSFVRYGRFRAGQMNQRRKRGENAPLRDLVAQMLTANRDRDLLPDSSTRELLGEYGLETPRCLATWNYAAARDAAMELGYPVILKGISPNVAHKNEAGLVSERISSENELKSAYESIHRRALPFKGETNGVQLLVEEFIPHRDEIILGVKYDATFGPVLLLGLGGVFAEVLRDYSVRLAPVTKDDARGMLADLKSFPVLQRSAREGKTDMEGLIDSILKVSELAVDLEGRITAIDINPLATVPSTSRTVVLDAKVYLSRFRDTLPYQSRGTQ